MKNQTIAAAPILTTAEKIATLASADVMKVYSGKLGGCSCGCRGTYRTNSKHVDVCGQDRGYAVTADEVNDTQVRKVLAVVQANAAKAESGEFGGVVHYAVDTDTRSFVVYLAPSNGGARR